MSGMKRLRRRVGRSLRRRRWTRNSRRSSKRICSSPSTNTSSAALRLLRRGGWRWSRFGGVQQAREKQREARGLMQIDILVQDLKYTLRKLMRDPRIHHRCGAHPGARHRRQCCRVQRGQYADAAAASFSPRAGAGVDCAAAVKMRPVLRHLLHRCLRRVPPGSRSYQDVTGYFAFSSPGNLELQIGNGTPEPATSIDVIANFFNVLGVQPEMGRLFRDEDGRNGAAPVIVLTDAWWRRQFNADPNIVGKAFDMNGQQTTVIGVLPPTFDFGAVFAPGSKVDAITPLNLYGPPRDEGNMVTMIGRMKPGVTLGQAVGEAARVAPTMCWNNRFPGSCGGYTGYVVPVPLKNYVTGRLRQSLTVLWWAVGMILLIACVNLSNLLLARATARSKEFAMRSALGAGRGRIVRQLLTESLVLSGAGALLGLLLAAIVVAWLRTRERLRCRCLSQLHIDGEALGWTLLIAVASAMLFGLVPGLRMAGGQSAGGAEGLRARVRDRAASTNGCVRCWWSAKWRWLHAAGGRGVAVAEFSQGSGCRPGLPAGARGRGDGGL